MSTHLYSPLDTTRREVRLLQLMQGQPSDEIICNLIVAPISDTPSFDALSYVWGDTDDKLRIQLCGSEFSVTTNLESALRQLRHADRPQVLWVDAICINQVDTQERNQQVRMMRSIYEVSDRVVVWLGPEDSSTKTFVDVILRITGDRTVHWSPSLNPSGTQSIINHWDLLRLAIFLRNPWWKRVWTLQEAIVAKELVFVGGSFVLTEQTFNTLVESFYEHYLKCCSDKVGNETNFMPLLELSNPMLELLQLERYRKDKARVDFLEFISLNRCRESTDPRDKVYGLLGITKVLDEEIINYELDVLDAYEDSTLEVIKRSGDLGVFSQVLGPPHKHRTENLPSWIPDWNGRYSFPLLRSLHYRQTLLPLFSASGNTAISLNKVSPKALAIQGVEFDTIDKIGAEAPLFSHALPAFNEWRSMAGVDRNPGRPYIGGGTWLNAYWRTLCLDIRSGKSKLLLTYGQGESSQGNERLDEYIKLFDLHVNASTTARRFFISTKGYIGLAPSSAQLQDRVCILLGGKVPLILRPIQGQPGDGDVSQLEYTLVGDAYVHGLMDGEAMGMVEKGEASLGKIILSDRMHESPLYK